MGADDDRLAAEAEVIEAAQRDPASFGILYEDNFDLVYAFVARRVENRSEAEDVTSIVFHKALAALPRYEWRGVPFAAWLLRIARNEVARRQHQPSTKPLGDEPPVEDHELEDVERRVIVFRLLRALPADQRRVLTLRFAHDQSVQQVAAALRQTTAVPRPRDAAPPARSGLMPNDDLDHLDGDVLAIAQILRHLPDDAFRARLRLDLERTIAMATSTVEGTVARPSGISYLHIPATDPRRSGAFYHEVFGWELRGDPEHPSFNDGTGHVIGAWVADLPPAGEAGILPYVFVDDVDETLAKVTANGCDIVKPPYPEEQLWVATFRDPAGNVVGVWQHGPRRQRT